MAEKNMNEKYFEWWLEELKKNGLVKEFEAQPKSFVLKEPIPIFYKHLYKTKDPLTKNFTLFNAITYTCDYRVIFKVELLNKLFGIFFSEERELLKDFNLKTGNVYQNTLFYSSEKGIIFKEGTNEIEYVEIYFDVKPPSKALQFSGKLGSSRDFKFNQRMTYDRHNIYVNKVVPIGTSTSLFNKTFTPKRYLFTDSGTAIRHKTVKTGVVKEKITIDQLEGYRSFEKYAELKNL